MIIVNSRVDLANLPQAASDLIDRIKAVNQTIGGDAVLDGQVTQQAMAAYVGGCFTPAPNGAHGNKNLSISADGRTMVTLVSLGLLHSLKARTKAWYFWLAYARSTPPAHAGEDICTLVEFYVAGTTAQTRLLYEYMRGIFLYTTDHYRTYYLIEQNGALARDF